MEDCLCRSVGKPSFLSLLSLDYHSRDQEPIPVGKSFNRTVDPVVDQKKHGS